MASTTSAAATFMLLSGEGSTSPTSQARLSYPSRYAISTSSPPSSSINNIISPTPPRGVFLDHQQLTFPGSSQYSSLKFKQPWTHNSAIHPKASVTTTDSTNFHFSTPWGADKRSWNVAGGKLAENVSGNIALDPKFAVAVAAAISSFIGKESQTTQTTERGES